MNPKNNETNLANFLSESKNELDLNVNYGDKSINVKADGENAKIFSIGAVFVGISALAIGAVAFIAKYAIQNR